MPSPIQSLLKENKMPKCKTCNKEDNSVDLHRTVEQILYGGTPIKREYRCAMCDVRLWRGLEKQRDSVR